LEASWYENINKIYSRRKDLVLEIVNKLGLSARDGQVGLFVWAKLPAGENSKDFTDRLLYEKHIFLAPGFIFGKESDHYVRLSLTVDEETLREVIRRVEEG
jgi:aspartate/methionine/tyrosine aminotransferase